MHAVLFEGSREEQQQFVDCERDKNSINPFDITVLETNESSVGINEIKSFTQSLAILPKKTIRLGIIYSAEKITIEGQNALLKTLEEPPLHAMIYILTKQSDSLLPTIISRCYTIKKQKNSILSPEIVQAIDAYLHEPTANKLHIHDSWVTNKDTALEWLDNLIIYFAKNITSPNKNIHQLRKLFRMKKMIGVNVNPKAVFDMFVF